MNLNEWILEQDSLGKALETTWVWNALATALRTSSYPHVHELMKKYAVDGSNIMSSTKPTVARSYESRVSKEKDSRRKTTLVGTANVERTHAVSRYIASKVFVIVSG